MTNYLVATIKDWNIDKFKTETPQFPGKWFLITNNEELTLEKLRELSPKYIFFPHWSWLVPNEILNEFECICFHMTDVPYGRGGSPLQNLISRGHKDTKLSALRMEKHLDSGPVYLKTPLSLQGTAREIFSDCAQLTFKMISTIVTLQPLPIPQSGTVVEFKRKTPADSELPIKNTIEEIYDLIRMLDADTYPKAFLNHGNIRIELSQAIINSETEINAHVKITLRDKPVS
ncbi:MAG: methionyl-tRNA formyltransferase [Colwellia sp.]|nr:methionyl-tRNA formyltransferase [Colwellia sp.]NQZ80641.1 methionyl-tRNA formyltransferase [Colwellia sp.]